MNRFVGDESKPPFNVCPVEPFNRENRMQLDAAS